MKYLIATALLLTCLVPAATPVFADEKSDAYALCVKELASRFGVDRNALKSFNTRLVDTGHYEIYGADANHSHISCNVINGRVKGVKLA